MFYVFILKQYGGKICKLSNHALFSFTASVPTGGAVGNILCPLPCLQGDSLLKRERKVTQVQSLVLGEYLSKYNNETAAVMSAHLTAYAQLTDVSNEYNVDTVERTQG